ncbi:hypothetical protein QA640_03235 [Bradyrhizobium sp. CB82]|uniref:hypothetical protein n=1 Tax=Bradyrhizobium sp. CB82 TaxID=3039159 RepID=UPI0024B040ED|nr:hypothetical protein [Bradyrhizobium sp. CB82]WFU41557.1 hypothetical protein QA640_03235 [Bradyrhizobium sp. CB82]
MAKSRAILNEFLASEMEIKCCLARHSGKEIAAMRPERRKSLIILTNQWEMPV